MVLSGNRKRYGLEVEDGKWIEEYIKLKKHLDLLEKLSLDEVAATWVENDYVHSGSYYYSDGELVVESEESMK